MRPDRNPDLFEPIYPDVLRAVSNRPRINMDLVECMVGIYPRMAYINQPIELVVILQSMIDQPLPVKIAIRPPTIDRDGNVVILDMARDQVTFTMKPGEVGVLRIPLMARPPTRPNKNLPIKVAIRYKPVPEANRVRPPGGGVPPSVLSVSPFKVQALQSMDYVDHKWDESAEFITVNLDLAPKNFPGNPEVPSPRYEPLWTQSEAEQDLELARARFDEAVDLAKPGARDTLFPALLEVVEERFAQHSMVLHPGEAAAIAKMMAYTVEDAPEREQVVVLESTRWFRALCQVLATDESLLEKPRHEIISRYIFADVMHDAILMAFHVLDSLVDEDLGSAQERQNYANRLMKWLAGSGEADLAYVYLPLVLGGVAMAWSVGRNWGGSPWYFYDQMLEAYNGRLRLATDATGPVFDMLGYLLTRYADKLRYQRIERPAPEKPKPASKPAEEEEEGEDGLTSRGIRRTGLFRRIE
ncbi:MAG: hypothetical protein ACOCXZ_00545 [Chloroflexota bacterium]